MTRPLSVHIAKDSILPTMSIDAGLAGVEMVNAVAPYFKIESDNQTVQFGLPSSPYVTEETVPYRALNGDLNIILTPRGIIRQKESFLKNLISGHRVSSSDYLGLAYLKNRVNSNRTALISISSEHPEQTVAHELGHLVSMWAYLPQGHCENEEESCIGIAEAIEGMSYATFCMDCIKELRHNARLLREAKAGKLGLAPNAKVF